MYKASLKSTWKTRAVDTSYFKLILNLSTISSLERITSVIMKSFSLALLAASPALGHCMRFSVPKLAQVVH